MTGPKGNWVLFPGDPHWGSRGNKTHCFPWGQSLSVLLYLPTQKVEQIIYVCHLTRSFLSKSWKLCSFRPNFALCSWVSQHFHGVVDDLSSTRDFDFLSRSSPARRSCWICSSILVWKVLAAMTAKKLFLDAGWHTNLPRFQVVVALGRKRVLTHGTWHVLLQSENVF